MIIKISKSGKALVVVDDFGNIYTTSLVYFSSLASGRMKAPFVQLTRMPVPAEPGRFKMSPVLVKGGVHAGEGDPGWSLPQCLHNVDVDRNSDAGLSVKQIEKRQKKINYQDKVVF